MTNDGLNLGQCITELEQWLKLLRSEKEPEPRAFFEFCSLCPGGLHSYRGYYEDLAIGYDGDWDSARISSIIERLKAAIGTEFYGYKGGLFTMHESTPLWVANSGLTGDTYIKGFKEKGYGDLLIVTGREED